MQLAEVQHRGIQMSQNSEIILISDFDDFATISLSFLKINLIKIALSAKWIFKGNSYLISLLSCSEDLIEWIFQSIGN